MRLLASALLLTACSVPDPDGPCGRPAGTDASSGPLSVGPNLRELEGQRFATWVSEEAAADPASATVLVAVHGYTGTFDDCQGKNVVWRQITGHADFAEDHGLVVVAPQFDETTFDWFQALNLRRVSDYGPRADQRLDAILDRTAELLPGLGVDRVLLTGFSAGGQFTHRYAWLHPDRVQGLAAGGAGSWAFPDPSVGWPYGTGELAPLRPSLDALCSSTTLFYVGADDDGSDEWFTDCSANWTAVCEQQGSTRTERATRFHGALLDEASRQGAACSPRLQVYEGVGHATPDEVDADVHAFLARSL